MYSYLFIQNKIIRIRIRIRNTGREMQEILMKWNVHKNNVLPLKQRCRMVILNHLCPQGYKKITELPLPRQLIKYLSIPELDDSVETFKCKPLNVPYIM